MFLTQKTRTGGPKAALGGAVGCGILLGVFEGVGVLLNKAMSDFSKPQMPIGE